MEISKAEFTNDTESPNGFTFTWSIKNFSYCTLKEKQKVESPEFKIRDFEEAKWYLRIYPKGCTVLDFISVFLCTDTLTQNCKYKFAIRGSNGQFKGKEEVDFPSDNFSNGYAQFFSISKLYSTDGYLENDTLTLSCRIRKEGNGFEPEHYYAVTKIKTIDINYSWTLKGLAVSDNKYEYKFDESTEVPIFEAGIPKLNLSVVKGDSYGEEDVHFVVQIGNIEDSVSIKCLVTVLDVDGIIIGTAERRHVFEKSSTSKCDFVIIPKQKLHPKDPLRNGNITLLSEFTLSVGNVFETVEFGRIDFSAPKCATQNLLLDGHEIWKENMSNFFGEQNFNDLCILTPNQRFPVHKAILCAHSKVFSAMFLHDTKERQAGEIRIDDIDDQTVSRMLKFLYSNTVEEVDSADIQNLFRAADKYAIESLRVICSKRLKKSLDVSNVCQVLALGDMHQDEDLKSSAKDFISANARAVVKSEGWEEVKANNAPLIFDVMEWLICNKFLKFEI